MSVKVDSLINSYYNNPKMITKRKLIQLFQEMAGQGYGWNLQGTIHMLGRDRYGELCEYVWDRLFVRAEDKLQVKLCWVLLLYAAQRGYALAQMRVAVAYAEGLEVEENLELAEYWLRQARKQGAPQAAGLLKCVLEAKNKHCSAMLYIDEYRKGLCGYYIPACGHCNMYNGETCTMWADPVGRCYVLRK